MSTFVIFESVYESTRPGVAAIAGRRCGVEILAVHAVASRADDAQGALAAAFDGCVEKPPWLARAASCRIAKFLRRDGHEVLSPEGRPDKDSEDPLRERDLDRERTSGYDLAKALAVPAHRAVP